MSASNYTDVSQDSDSVSFAPVGEGGISAEDPFQPNDSFMNNNNNDDLMESLTGTASGAVSGGGSVSDGSAMSMSLLERIQQQKKNLQPNASAPTSAPAPASQLQADNLDGMNNDSPFGYPMAEDTIYSHSSSAVPPSPHEHQNNPINIPNYASPNLAPNPYDESTSSSSDFKDQMMNALWTVGSAANSAARGAYRGTKYMYQKISNKSGSNSGAGGAADAMNAHRRNEMDYQRESLLMDPHDLEDRAAPFGAGSGMNMGMGMGGSGSAPTNGLMGGMGSGSALMGGAQDGSYSILGYLKQFCVDIKDIFLAAPRKVQILVVVLAIFIIWLFISEEL